MTAKSNIARPVRIKIDEVQVDGTGETGGHGVYKLAAMGDDYALFRKVTDVAANTDGTAATVQPPA